MAGSYDYRLVALSILIAVLASYAVLDLAGRVTAARGTTRMPWLGSGATAPGIGIWSVHYVGMLAFRLPVSVQYDWSTVFVSLLTAVFASAVGLFVASRKKMGLLRASLGSAFMGSYSKTIVAVSVALAIVISFVALSLTFHFREATTSGGWQKALSAVVMGAAIPVMHYTVEHSNKPVTLVDAVAATGRPLVYSGQELSAFASS
jgi:NO-binding membrane sensor protein with MHYT domain